MKRLSKVKKLFFIFFAFVLFLQGCSTLPDQVQEIDQSKDKAAKNKTKIQFSQWSVTSTKLVEKTINTFNETNKDNIYVDVLKIPMERYIETLNMLNSSGQGPDVYEVAREWLDSYLYKGYVADLSPYIDEGFTKAYPKWAKDFGKNPLYKDKFYSLPSNLVTYRIIYNKDLFKASGLDPEKPPQTLEELKNYAKTISFYGRGNRKYGFALPLAEEWQGFVQSMEAVNAYSGIYFYNFLKGRYDLSVYKPWLSTIKELSENGGLFPGMETMKSELALAQFAQGNIGMMYAASWEVSSLFNELKPTCNWGVALPPVIDTESAGKGAVVVNSAGWNIINSNTSHMEEAVKVWKYLYSDDYIGEMYKNHSAVPVLDSIRGNSRYTPSEENYTRFLPGEKDSIYPNTPLVMEEWQRKEAYHSALLNNPMDKFLTDESARLDSLLNISVTSETLNDMNYFNPGFDPKYPLGTLK